MRNIIIYLLIVFSLPLLTLAHETNPHDDLIIRMNDNGFEPRELTVTEGDEVLFINNDDTDRWPASNFHPTHTLYPEFDPLKGIPPGSSWKTTFNKVGHWRMHDHLIPHMTGTIVVLKNPNATTTPETAAANKEVEAGFIVKIKAFISKFWQMVFSTPSEAKEISTALNPMLLNEFKDLNDTAKYAWLENTAEEESPELAWRYVKEAYLSPEGVVGNPHDLAHLVGQLLFKARGFEGLSTCEPIFAFGCYHGLMEVAFDKDKPEEYMDNILAAQKGCQALGIDEAPQYWSCIHGMGHGIATFRDHNLAKSLNDCDTLVERVRTYCHDGVFMELSISAPPSFYKKERPIYPCDIVLDTYKTSCARSQVQVMRLQFKMTTENIARTCLETKSDKIIYHCIDAIGYFVGQTSKGDSSEIIAGCREIKHEKSAAQCTAAATGELIFQDYAGWQNRVNEICDSLDGQYRTSCYDRIEKVKKSYDRS